MTPNTRPMPHEPHTGSTWADSLEVTHSYSGGVYRGTLAILSVKTGPCGES